MKHNPTSSDDRDPTVDRHDVPQHCCGIERVPIWARGTIVVMVLFLAGFGVGTIISRAVDLLGG